jgi:hypothetical protein
VSKATEQAQFSDGLALGALMLGVEAINGNKTTLELDFRAAWRDWPHRSHYPSIKAGPAYDDLFSVMSRSATRSSHHIAEWETWPFVPTLLFDWTDEELADSINDAIPAAAWRALVRDWLSPTMTLDADQ